MKLAPKISATCYREYSVKLSQVTLTLRPRILDAMARGASANCKKAVQAVHRAHKLARKLARTVHKEAQMQMKKQTKGQYCSGFEV